MREFIVLPLAAMFFCELHHTLSDLGTDLLGEGCGGEGEGLWPGSRAARSFIVSLCFCHPPPLLSYSILSIVEIHGSSGISLARICLFCSLFYYSCFIFITHCKEPCIIMRDSNQHAIPVTICKCFLRTAPLVV